MTIRITGPESSGKTTLAIALAETLGGTYVPEAARAYLELREGRYDYPDLAGIWAAQRAAENAARASAAPYVVCDTGPEVIRIWAEVKYGRCPPDVLRASRERTYDLTLLCYPDLPWTPDPLRETPSLAERRGLFARYVAVLEDYTVIRGQDRLAVALAAVRD